MAEKGADKGGTEKGGGAEQDDGIGMDKQEIKKLLKRSRNEPVNCALMQGDPKDGGLGLILLDKVRPSKQLVKDLKEKFPTARTPCFGTAAVDADKDMKLVTFSMNKSIPGLDRKMKKSLKGTGYTKVEIERGDGGDADE